MTLLKFIYKYIRLIHDYIYYRKVYYVNKNNIPPKGSSVIVVCNHQNAINDPLALEFCFNDRKFYIFARASLFASRFGNWFFRGLDVLPAFRLKTDGEESLKNNFDSFKEAGQILADGGIVGLFPEGTNQYKHFLGEFSQAYLRLGFETAQHCDYKREIYILPVSVHYSDYFKFRADMMLICGKPIALSPYFEQYKTRPRSTCRTVNKTVHKEVEQLMIDIQDEDNYEAIEYLRNSYGNKFARLFGLNPRILPEKLQSDKLLTNAIKEYSEKNPSEAEDLFTAVLNMKTKTENAKLKDNVFDYCPSALSLLFKAFAFLLLLPVFVFGLYPNILCYFAPMPMVDKMKKLGGPFALFQSGLQLGINALITIPLSYLAVFIADVALWGWLAGCLHLIALPVLGVFAWDYSRQWKKFMGQLRYRTGKNSDKIKEIIKIRSYIFQKTDDITSTYMGQQPASLFHVSREPGQHPQK